MAKLDFPDASYSPWVAPNNVIYTYIGTSPNGYWEANTANAATNLTAVFVERTGSTMTGALKLDNAGNVALPDISFDGDVNSGIYSPGADSLAITTGGTQRVTVDSLGRVGIGTSSPDGELDVTGTGDANGGVLVVNDAGACGAQIKSPDPTILFYETDTTNTNYQLRLSSGNLLVQKQNDTLNGADTKVTIDSSGKVGIGTTSPSESLEVAGNGLKISGQTSGVTDEGITFDWDSGSNNGRIFSESAGSSNLLFYTTSSGSRVEKMRITSSGNVGIGTSSPNAKLDVGGQILLAEGNEIGWHDGTGTQAARIYASATDELRFERGSSALRSMTIDSSGNVGVGETSPDLKFHVKETINVAYSADNATDDANNLLKLENPSTTANAFAGMAFRTGSGADMYFGAIQQSANAGDFYFANQNSPNKELMRITSSGNVGIGTSLPLTKCHLDGPTGAGSTMFLSASNLAADAGGSVGFGGNFDGTNRTSWASVDGLKENATSGNYGGYLAFKTRPHGGFNTERMRIDSAGNVGVGTSSPGSPTYLPGTIVNVNGAAYSGYRAYGGGTSVLHLYQRDDLSILASAQNNNAKLAFYTGSNSGTERMRIDNLGKVLIGKTATNFAVQGIELRENGEIVCTRTSGDVITTRRLGTEGTHFSFRNVAGSYVGTIVTTSSSTAYNTSSDYRLKENVVDIADGITRVKQLQPRRFNFIADNTTTVDGFIAHEAQTVVPEAVTGEKDGEEMQGIDQSKLVPLLTAALQEAIGEIETLKQRLSDAGIA